MTELKIEVDRLSKVSAAVINEFGFNAWVSNSSYSKGVLTVSDEIGNFITKLPSEIKVERVLNISDVLLEICKKLELDEKFMKVLTQGR